MRCRLELPIHIHKSRPAGGNCERVVIPIFPGHGAVRSDLDEFELDGLPGRHGNIQEPIREIWVQHWTDGGIKGRTPVSQFDSISGEKDEVANVCLNCIVHRKSHRDELCREHFKLNRIGGCATGILKLHVVDTWRNIRNIESHLRVGPAYNARGSGAEEHAPG